MRFKFFFGTVVCALFLLTGTSQAIFVTSNVGAGSRGLGLGGNNVALVNDATAYYVNPAAMAFSSARELSASAEWHRLNSSSSYFRSDTGTSSQFLRFSQIGLLRSFPTSKGGFAIGLGYISPISFDDLSYYHGTYIDKITGDTVQSLFDNTVAGQLNLWGGGFGLQVAPGLGLGFSAFLITGGSSMMRHDFQAINRSVDPNLGDLTENQTRNYLGVDVRAGLMYTISSWAVTAIRIDLPQFIAFAEQNRFESGVTGDITNLNDTGILTSPLSGAIGLAFPLSFVKIAGEARFRTPYQGVGRDLESSKWKFGAGAGLEVPVPALPLVLRGGYSLDEFDPYAYLITYSNEVNPDTARYTGSQNKTTISGGLSWLLGQKVSLDGAYVFSKWQLDTKGVLTESNTDHRISLSFSLRY